MHKSFRKSIFAVTLIIIIVVLSSFVFPIANFAYALSKKDFLIHLYHYHCKVAMNSFIKWLMDREINITMIIS